MVSTRTRHIIMLLVGWMVAVSAASAANITATVDRRVVQENESFYLTFSSDTSVDREPDFSALEKDFRIINRSQSSNIQIINGRMNREITWKLMMMPKRPGNMTIPAVSFGNDKSNPVSIQVTEATANQQGRGDELVYMEAMVDREQAYIQSQVVYTLRIYHAMQLRNATLTDLDINDEDAIVEKLTDKKSYEKYIDGKRFRVIEKQYAIFPQTVGELVIEPATLETQYIAKPRILRNKRVSSQRLTVQVQPKPAAAKNSNASYWLPAYKVKLEEEWSGDVGSVRVGEPITRTLTLTAVGLSSAQLPQLSEHDSGDDIKQYADQPVLDDAISDHGFVGSREEKIAYIPSQPGKVKLPAIEVAWWNIEKDRLEKTTVPGKVINVLAGAGSKAVPGSMANNRTDSNDLKNPTGAAQGGASDGQFSGLPLGSPPTIAGLPTSIWFWASMVLMVLWLATIALWFYRSRKAPKAAGPAGSRETEVNNISARDIKAACNSNNPQQAKDTLIQWAQQRWPESLPTSLGHIAQRVDGNFADELRRLNTILYKPDTSGATQWRGDALWQAAQDYIEKHQKQYRREKPVIQPLYKVAVINDEPTG